MMRLVKVGYVTSDEKCKTHGINLFDHSQYGGYEFCMFPIDPCTPLETQVKCDFIIHKIHIYFVEQLQLIDRNDILNRIQHFCDELKRIKIPLVDPWASVCETLYRSQVAHIISSCEFELNGIKIKSPPTFEVDSEIPDEEFIKIMAENNLNFPFMTKPRGGLLPKFRYDMSIHFSASVPGYASITDQFKQLIPCMIQKFYNHGGHLYKLYVIGDEWYISVRASVIDFDSKQLKPLFFKSCTISRKNCSSKASPKIKSSEISTHSTLDTDVIDSIVQRLKALLDFNLIGIDIIVDQSTNTYYIVDLNYFPGFKDIPDFRLKMLKLFHKMAIRLNI
ncbi:hypothetical protein HZS_2477 [Henneguya salminicola]|nr:hypothetical protein HZS_2477 [Henneguya salminicola]